METFSSPTRFLPPLSPARAASPSPRRSGRSNLGSDESHSRNLSPATILRAFTVQPMPYDTRTDQYKIFACIENLTAAEKDLGLRVAKAAHRLQSWCEEIKQWGWAGTFETPSEEYQQARRKSLEGRIRQHTKDDSNRIDTGLTEYWGPMLSVEVERREARLDEIGDELPTLDIEELKENILDMHGSRSRPSSSYSTKSRSLNLLDDFSILITQTLLQALPYYSQLKLHLDTWSARVFVLRESPRFKKDLRRLQHIMQASGKELEPPSNIESDAEVDDWKEAVDKISEYIQGKVADLGKRLDRMLDTLEGREDCLPDEWIDTFEAQEADFGKWTAESRRIMIDVDIRRMKALSSPTKQTNRPKPVDAGQATPNGHRRGLDPDSPHPTAKLAHIKKTPDRAMKTLRDAVSDISDVAVQSPTVAAAETARSGDLPDEEPAFDQEHVLPNERFDGTAELSERDDTVLHEQEAPSFVRRASVQSMESFTRGQVKNINVRRKSNSSASTLSMTPARRASTTPESPISTINNQMPSFTVSTPGTENIVGDRSSSPFEPDPELQAPHTPPSRSRRGSTDSASSNQSFGSSPPSVMGDSPSIRPNRQSKAPRPPLNSAMQKRRAPIKKAKEGTQDNQPPWPPTRFSGNITPADENHSGDLNRQISNVLATIPTNIRLDVGINDSDPKSTRSVSGSTLSERPSHSHLRSTRAANGLKSPELTLSPAKPDFDSSFTSSRRNGNTVHNDNEPRLYYLSQPGKKQRIKLFIRKSGENSERIMVRVGGGWSDLGEYLRNLVVHHGHRTASEKFEVLGLETPSVSFIDGTSKISNYRPDSAMGRKTAEGVRGSPAKGTSGRDSALGTPNAISTPNVGKDIEAEHPSTGSSRHSWTGNEVGLAGPKAKKLDLSGEKLEWIEKMTKEARRVSGHVPKPDEEEKKKDGGRESKASLRGSESRNSLRGERVDAGFGDLGTAGGTKRVWMRGGGRGTGEH